MDGQNFELFFTSCRHHCDRQKLGCVHMQ